MPKKVVKSVKLTTVDKNENCAFQFSDQNVLLILKKKSPAIKEYTHDSQFLIHN